MIHSAARQAVGKVHGKLMGHCVLVGQRLAVTCAHVLTEEQAKPKEVFPLDFPLLKFKPTAKVIGWAPYDINLSAGSDIAILELQEDAPEDSWVKFEPQRPESNTTVVAQTYLTGIPEGSPRRATVHYSGENVIFLAGQEFLEAGCSGTGVFYRDHGERLLGLAGWKPPKGQQTEAYVIPSDQIVKLLDQVTKPASQNADRDVFQDMCDLLLSLESPNRHPVLKIFIEAARKVLDKPRDAWTEADIKDLLSLQRKVMRAGSRMGGPLHPRLGKPLKSLADLTGQMGDGNAHLSDPIPWDETLGDALTKIDGDLEEFAKSSSCPKVAHQPIETLRREITWAVETEEICPADLSDYNASVERHAGAAYRQAGRGIPYLWRHRLDLLPPGTVFVDSLDLWAPEMVIIGTGTFLMGSPDGEPDRDEDEGPQHEVHIGRKFALAKHALTFEEYLAFCDATGRTEPRDNGWGKGRHPVINVSWHDAVAWCAWISERFGADYRLPSEAEWEYACRAGTKGPFWFGDTITPDQANYDGTQTYNGGPKGIFREQTLPVDADGFKANPFGLWHMHGNVSEWCADHWEDNYEEPRSQAPFLSNDNGRDRVGRGGSWNFAPRNLRSALRGRGEPDVRTANLGFRPARTLLPL